MISGSRDLTPSYYCADIACSVPDRSTLTWEVVTVHQRQLLQEPLDTQIRPAILWNLTLRENIVRNSQSCREDIDDPLPLTCCMSICTAFSCVLLASFPWVMYVLETSLEAASKEASFILESSLKFFLLLGVWPASTPHPPEVRLT